MHSRMKEKGNLVQPEKEFQIRNPWIPQTPGNQIQSRSNRISIDRNGNQLGKRNWSEFFELLDRHSKQMSSSNRACDSFNHSNQMGNAILTSGNSSNLTEPLNYSGILRGRMNQINNSNSMVNNRIGNGNLDHNLNSQTRSYKNDIPSWSDSLEVSNRVWMGNTVEQPSFPTTNVSPTISLPRGMNQVNFSPPAPSILNSYSEVNSSWTRGNFTSLLLGDEISDVSRNNNMQQILNNGSADGFHVFSVQHNYYNLNSPPRRDSGNAGTSNVNSFPLASITPDHRNLLEKHRQSEIIKLLVDDGSCQEHEKMENLIISSMGNEAIDHQCSELLQTITTPQAENKISEEEKGVQEVIDLNETPKQKTPKRRKHRPKVVIEGKPKRMPKPKIPNNGESEENPSRKKRKYVQKNRDPEVEIVTPQQTNVVNTDEVPNYESREETSCRKRLNFDCFEKANKGETQYTAANVQRARHQGNHPVLELNIIPANEMPVKSSLVGEESHDPVRAAQSGIINCNTLNLIARNLCRETNENRENSNTAGELNKGISRPNAIVDKSRVIRWKSTHQMVERDTGNFKGFYESKEGYSDPTIGHVEQQVGTSSDPKLSSSSMCEEPFQSENQRTKNPSVGKKSSEETCKKQKTEPEKGCLINGESTIDVENYRQKVLTALKQKMVLERMMRERMADRSNQVNSSVMANSNQKSANIIKSKQTDGAIGCKQQTENYQKASTQNNRLNMTENPCRIVSFCTNQVPLHEPKDNLHLYQQQFITARGQPKSVKRSKKAIDEITFQLQSLSIKGENGDMDGKDKYALVPYGGGDGIIVPYEPKRRKPRPKVDLDPETTRIWKLLMGKEGTEASEAENRDKEKWWEEERKVFQGRADSFIARMHLVQGDRRSSPWKGSVVDSIIGVFLTQNVSDQLSSSAFMALAAQFPLSVATPDQTSDQSGTSILTEEQEIQGPTPNGTTEVCYEKIIGQPFYSQTSETYLGSLGTGRMEPKQVTKKNAGSSKNPYDFSIHPFNGEIQSSSGSSSEAEDSSSNGGKSIKNKTGLTSAQRTAPPKVAKNPEYERLCFDDRSMHFYKQSSGLDYDKQIQGSYNFNLNLNRFSPLNHPVSSSITSMQNLAMPPTLFQLLMAPQVTKSELDFCEISREEFTSSFPLSAPEMTQGMSIGYQEDNTAKKMCNTLFQQNGFRNSQKPNIDPFAFLTEHLTVQKSSARQEPQITHQKKRSQMCGSEHKGYENHSGSEDQVPSVSKHTGPSLDIQEGTTAAKKQVFLEDRSSDGHDAKEQACFSGKINTGTSAKTLNTSIKHEKDKREAFDWDSLRKMVQSNGRREERSKDALDSMDYEAMRCADVNVISDSIRIRGMNNMLSERIKDFLNRVVSDHGSIDLEWLRDVPPDKAKDYLLSIRGLGLKSVECVRLLTLHHLAFPVDTNVGRIAVRLGWVPLQPLPESLQLHLLEMYPVLESVQKYLWPRLCKLDQKTLYELHYQLITFGKVFCTKSKPNCNACPMRGECRHFASAFASARLALPAPEEKGIVGSTMPIAAERRAEVANKPMLLQPPGINGETELTVSRCEPIIEEPATPEPEISTEIAETDIEDAFYEDPDEIPIIRLNVEQLAVNLRNFMEEHTDLQEGDMSKALVALTPEVASIPVPKLKYVLRLRTERQVYVLTDAHPLVKELDKREPDDPSPYLLALLAPGEETASGQPSGRCCESDGSGELCKEKECSLENGDENSLTVRGTLLIPCRTAMRGSFPLNGTYFQVNEVFADHESSLKPIDVPRAWLWHLETRTVLFGTSATSIFKGMTTKEIQNSFWRGFVCVRGFDRKTRAPRPLNRNLHIPHSKIVKTSNAA